MTRITQFDGQLEKLTSAMSDMATLCRDNLVSIARALRSADASSLSEVSGRAVEIDQRERDVEALCLRLFLRQHPVATDLRKVSAALKMITDLQRIGHQTSDAAAILASSKLFPSAHMETLAGMACGVISMLDKARSADEQGDATMAREAMDDDDAIDAAYAALRSQLVADIRSPATSNLEPLLDLMMVAKYFERMGDHIVIYASWIIFRITGERLCFSDSADPESPASL